MSKLVLDCEQPGSALTDFGEVQTVSALSILGGSHSACKHFLEQCTGLTAFRMPPYMDRALFETLAAGHPSIRGIDMYWCENAGIGCLTEPYFREWLANVLVLGIRAAQRADTITRILQRCASLKTVVVITTDLDGNTVVPVPLSIINFCRDMRIKLQEVEWDDGECFFDSCC
eukprot:gnl/TRDRNA2_/TRDRNA2_159198_c4_seq1.p1 gnl/TRDRNA2_/TRDRNA2_159198_c4~~gnl/TRDRNA2_/TRDRNA2_159198_c4_seq1.p1  ORF type:complete len:195 (-),score=13.59 gnl/TRDRNA2_/TRDRNA2_159198_c4_seq1:91-609(-)